VTEIDNEAIAMMRSVLELRAVTEMVQRRIPSRSVGTDPARIVEAVVDASGTLSELTIRPRWQEQIRPTALGKTVLAAITAAYQDQLRTLAALPGRFTPPTVTDDEARAALAASVTDAEAGLDFGPHVNLNEAAEHYLRLAQGKTAAPEPTASAGPVTVTVQSGRVVDVTIDPAWAASVPVFSICAAVKQAATSPPTTTGEADDLLFAVLSTMTQLKREV
jgi:hypothetical protein